MCKGKRRFRQYIPAMMEMQRIREKHSHRPKLPKRVYQCPKCHGFHLTHLDLHKIA